MKMKLIALSTLGLTLAGCKTDPNSIIDLGSKAAQIASLSDQEVKTLANKSCAQMDASSKVATTKSAYTKRLNKITKTLGNNINGTKINYKVYLTDDINAWAMANGCVRVYSGLMDKMTDNEIQGILGHELGHVALGHSKRAIQVAYATQLGRDTISSSAAGATISALTNDELLDFTDKLINAQFSQKQESDADNYSFDLLRKKGINPEGIATSFEKLGSDNASILSSHPSSKDRAKNIRKKLAEASKEKK